MRLFLTGCLLALLVFTSSCARQAPVSGSVPSGAGEGQARRFEVIYEHPETKYIGGLTVLRDNATGCEYLIVTGLNGSPVVVPLQGDAGQREYSGPAR
ncbi:DUF6440 family protein [Desulfovirgula thermocuniculi]|uniref:DUF6440 family protein n=1 Tax=Desulfovirgula thermocuniculi TaxID=348842 RepID=UPI00040DD336|nr:DUF6440 family protein [Desulfovirgula thermocuniculi]